MRFDDELELVEGRPLPWFDKILVIIAIAGFILMFVSAAKA